MKEEFFVSISSAPLWPHTDYTVGPLMGVPVSHVLLRTHWKHCCLGVFRILRQYSSHNTPLGHYTDRSPVGLGQYNGLGEYCGPHTASSVFL